MTQHKCMNKNKVVCQTWTVLELGPFVLNQTMLVRCYLYSIFPILSRPSHVSYLI